MSKLLPQMKNQVNIRSMAIGWFSACLSLTVLAQCATIVSLKDNPRREAIYSGTRWNATNIGISGTHAHNPTPDTLFRLLSILDFPFSLVLDTVLLPITVPYALTAGEKAGPANPVIALLGAASAGNSRKVESLLKSGVKIDAVGPQGQTALCNILLSGQPKFQSRKLVQPGIHSARHMKTAKLLIERGAPVNQRCQGHTPLRIAVRWWHPQIIALLLKNGADANAAEGSEVQWSEKDREDSYHFSALGLAIVYSPFKLEVARLLVNAGVKVNAWHAWRRDRPQEAQSALHMAVALQHTSPLTEFLLGSGANPNLASYGWTPLHALMQIPHPLGQQPMVPTAPFVDTQQLKLLLKAGAKPDAHDMRGRTPRQVAEAMREKEVAEIMRSYQ